MYLSDLHKIFAMLSMSVARSFSDSLRYVMYFRFMNDVMFVYIVARYRRRDSDLTGSSKAYGVAPWRILKLTHQG